MKSLIVLPSLFLAVAAAAQSQYCGAGTYWNPLSQECQSLYDCGSDIDNDGLIGISDLMSLLSGFGESCETPEIGWDCGDDFYYQGYLYETVWIGESCWFADNLRVNSLSDGTGLSNEWSSDVGSSRVYGQSDTGCMSGVCDSTLNDIIFGRHYSYNAIENSIGICPVAWHVSTFLDWGTLMEVIGENNGEAIKSTQGWYSGNGTNSSGLNIFPSGGRGGDGYFLNANSAAYFWAMDSLPLYAHVSWTGSIGVPAYDSANEALGCTIRCVRD